MEKWIARHASSGQLATRSTQKLCLRHDPDSDDEMAQEDLCNELFGDYLSGAETAKRTCKIARMICKVRPNRHTEDTLLKIAKAGQSKTNACRNLHVLINQGKVLLPVPSISIAVLIAMRSATFAMRLIGTALGRTNDWLTSLGSSKAFDTSLVLAWQESLLIEMDCQHEDLLQALKVIVLSANTYFRTMRKHGVFIPDPDRQVVVRAGYDMVEGFSYLATKCYNAGLKLFRLRPKIHFQQHLTMNMSAGSKGLSVLNYSCWSDEDFVGRVARLSRSCHPATASFRTYQKALALYGAVLKPKS